MVSCIVRVVVRERLVCVCWICLKPLSMPFGDLAFRVKPIDQVTAWLGMISGRLAKLVSSMGDLLFQAQGLVHIQTKRGLCVGVHVVCLSILVSRLFRWRVPTLGGICRRYDEAPNTTALSRRCLFRNVRNPALERKISWSRTDDLLNSSRGER